MIHYMLLPKDEMRSLRREYRVRLSIVALFFFSCAIVVGMITLLPSFLLVQAEKKELLVKYAELKKTEKESGADQIEKALLESQAIAQKILETENGILYSDAIQKIISRRPNGVSLKSFEISRMNAVGTTTPVSVQGVAQSREILLEFKKRLESDPSFKNVELPISNLAKSKNVDFTVKLVVHSK